MEVYIVDSMVVMTIIDRVERDDFYFHKQIIVFNLSGFSVY